MKCLLISACLLGSMCKYSGGANTLPEEVLKALRQRWRLIPVCPETAGGLPIPREPSERQGERVVNRIGQDVTAEYKRGAGYALILARRYGCETALLKEKSPSCGCGRIYDGSFSKTLIPGDGVTSELLKKDGIKILGESRADEII